LHNSAAAENSGQFLHLTEDTQAMNALSGTLPDAAQASTKISILGCLVVWRDRIRGRRALAKMDVRLLADIGLTPASAATEIAKPWWVA
jgi:uncharacterized protein YjiS (DUF1127 family)